MEVEVKRAKGEIKLSYYYKKEGEPDSSYQTLKEEVKELTADFTKLEQNTIYNIKIVVKDENGIAQKIINEKTGILTGTVTQKGETIWNSGIATIELETKETGMTIQYQIGGIEGQWTDYEGPITGLKYGETVYAVVTDRTNQSAYSTINLLDEINPQQAQIKLSSKNTTTAESITATVTHIDNESGVEIINCRWVYNTNLNSIGTDASNYPNTFSSNGQTITLSTTTVGTYYLHILTVDKAGKLTETISEPITVAIPNSAPTTPMVSFSNKTTNSITVTANATDSNNDNLTYSLYVSTSQASGFTKAATSAAMSSGSTATLTAPNLNQYTSYYYYVTVTDGKLTSTSSTSSAVRTYCPGTGLTCPGGTTQTVKCPYCNGYGSGTRCSECGGTSWHNNPTTYCPLCGARGTRVSVIRCSMCRYGDYQQTLPCSHGLTYSHSYCSHGYTGQHD